MSKEYSVGGGGLTLANQAVTLLGVVAEAAPNVALDFLRFWASQQGSATSAQQRVQITTQVVSGSPALTAATPSHLKLADTVASIIAGGAALAAGTAGINASAESGGARTVLFEDNFNVLNGWLWIPTPREVINVPGGFASALTIFLPVAPASLTNWATGANFAEV